MAFQPRSLKQAPQPSMDCLRLVELMTMRWARASATGTLSPRGTSIMSVHGWPAVLDFQSNVDARPAKDGMMARPLNAA